MIAGDLFTQYYRCRELTAKFALHLTVVPKALALMCHLVAPAHNAQSRQRSNSQSINQSINQSKRKTSYANGQINLGHIHRFVWPLQ